MTSLTTEERQAIEAELEPSERVLWSGKPNPRVIFHMEDSFLIPFSLMWGGFAIFWERGVIKEGWTLGQLWGIPFVVIGQYLIWGRFLYENWKKRRILYVLTDRRAVVIVRPPQGKTISGRLAGIGAVEKRLRSDGRGTIIIGSPIITRPGARSKGNFDQLGLSYGVPVFVDIDNADQVYRSVEKARAQVQSLPGGESKVPFPSLGILDS